jgi:hypothetical protein
MRLDYQNSILFLGDFTMGDDLITAINRLAIQTGKMEGKFDGLEKYIKGKTDTCQRNYENLGGHLDKLTKKINGVVIEKEVEERVTGKFKKVLYNRVTLLCTIIGLAIAFIGLEKSNSNKSEKKLIEINKEIRQLKRAGINLKE